MIDKSRTNQGSQVVLETVFRLLSLLKYGRLMVVLAVFAVSLGLVYITYARSVYEARGTIRYNLFQLSVQNETVAGSGRVNYFPLLRILLTRLQSEYLLKLTAEEMGLVDSTSNFSAVRSLIFPSVRIEVLSDGVISVFVQSYNQQVAREMPAKLVEVYNRYQSNLERENRAQLLHAYNEELTEIGKKVSETFDSSVDYLKENSILETFIEQNQLTEIPREMIIIKHRLSRIEQTRQMLTNPALDTVSRLSLISNFEKEPMLQVGQIVPNTVDGRLAPFVSGKKTDEPAAASSNLIVNPATLGGLEPWQKLERDLRGVQEEIARASTKYLPGHVEMQNLEQKKGELEMKLEQELKTALNRFELDELNHRDRLQKLEAQLPEYREVMKQYEGFVQKYNLLQTEKQTWNNAYKAMQDRIRAIDFDSEREKIVVKYGGLISASEKPVSPNKKKVLYASLALGLALCFGVPFLLEMLRDTSLRLEDLERRVDLNGLGVIPLTSSANQRPGLHNGVPPSEVLNFFLESFRIVRSGIAFNQGKHVPSQVIMISSARPGEGKTTVSANLAAAFASMVETTLVIDADLRRGQQHKKFELATSVGLTQVLLGQASIESAIVHDVCANLSVLTRGKVAVGSSEKLCNRGFDELLRYCREHYQRVIIDTPPILGLSETVTIQRLVDGVVIVVNAGSTPTATVKAATDIIHKAGGRFYGFVLNRIDFTKISNIYCYPYYSPNYYAQVSNEPDDVR